MTNIQREIPIFFSVDDNYVPFLAVALNSAIKNSSINRCYRAIVLHQGLSSENTLKIKSLEKENFKIELVPMKENFLALEGRIEKWLRFDYSTLTIYFRLFIPEMFKEYDKGIYIDSDVVLTTDIANLFDTDIGDNYIGACHDMSIADYKDIVLYTEKAVGVKKNEYINSGVLLMNMKKMREDKFEEHFLDLLNTYHFDSIAPDQDYINAMCNGKIYYLDPRWDAMPNDARHPMESIFLVHYNLFSKPWCYTGVQYEEEFWKYAVDSGFYFELMAKRDNYSEEEKESDRGCLKLLMERGLEIISNSINFKKLHQKGVKIRL